VGIEGIKELTKKKEREEEGLAKGGVRRASEIQRSRGLETHVRERKESERWRRGRR